MRVVFFFFGSKVSQTVSQTSPENPSTWEIAWLDALSHWLSLGDWMCGGKISMSNLGKLYATLTGKDAS